VSAAAVCHHRAVATEAHLQMIQAVVTRLASQSTTVKGWCVTVTGALLSFGATSATPIVPLIAIYVVLAFAALDAYYLALERAYRALYHRVAAGRAETWTLDITRPTAGQVGTALRSPAIAILYGTSLLVAAIIGTYLLA
jgi:hypothetical protein